MASILSRPQCINIGHALNSCSKQPLFSNEKKNYLYSYVLPQWSFAFERVSVSSHAYWYSSFENFIIMEVPPRF